MTVVTFVAVALFALGVFLGLVRLAGTYLLNRPPRGYRVATCPYCRDLHWLQIGGPGSSGKWRDACPTCSSSLIKLDIGRTRQAIDEVEEARARGLRYRKHGG